MDRDRQERIESYLSLITLLLGLNVVATIVSVVLLIGTVL